MFDYGCVVGLNIKGGGGTDEAETRGIDDQPLSGKPSLMRRGETYSL